MTKPTQSIDGDAERAEIMHLLEQRSTVQQWLARLDQQRGSVSERILDRVRQDYERRLQEALDALAEHRLALNRELDRALSALSSAEEEHQLRLDELEEARLRHLIGEIDERAWAERQSQMESAVESASEEEIAAREESERLRDLLRQLDDRVDEEEAEPVYAIEPEPQPVRVASNSDETMVWTREDTPASSTSSATPFLEDIDRALTEPPTAVDSEPAAEPEPGDTAPKPGIKCQECGYTNDLSAWFCGVCGADVG